MPPAARETITFLTRIIPSQALPDACRMRVVACEAGTHSRRGTAGKAQRTHEVLCVMPRPRRPQPGTAHL
eukprot:271643-Chlamydomonas_euryale.AAC.1